MGRPAGVKDDELNQVFLEIGDVLIRCVPSDGATAVDGKSAALYSLALPVHAGVLHHPWSKIVHDGGDSLFATESIEERQFSLNLSGLIGRLGGAGAIR